MADERIKDFSGEIISSEIAALLNTLYLAVDDASFTDAEKILLKTILTSTIVSSDSNNYQALTPKGFYDSVMTTTRKGIGQLSLDADVTSKSGTGLLNSVHQVLMKSQWFKDWFITSTLHATVPEIYFADDLTDMGALSFQANLSLNLIQYQTAQISPALPDGKRFDSIVYSVGTNHASVVSNYAAFGSQIYTGAVVYEWIGGSQIGLAINAAGTVVQITSQYAPTGIVKFSGTINAIITDI